jgi:hypothetical protein
MEILWNAVICCKVYKGENGYKSTTIMPFAIWGYQTGYSTTSSAQISLDVLIIVCNIY